MMMMMDHHAGGVGDVTMGFRPIGLPAPGEGSGAPLMMGFGGYVGVEDSMLGGGGRGGGPWPMQHYSAHCPPSGNPASPRIMHGSQPYPPGRGLWFSIASTAAYDANVNPSDGAFFFTCPRTRLTYCTGDQYGYAPHPSFGNFSSQPQLQPEHPYYSEGYGGYSPYPFYQSMPPSGGPGGPIPPAPYPMQQPASSGAGGSNGIDRPGPGYGEFRGAWEGAPTEGGHT